MEQTKRVALYGGTFDPIHLGHLAVAERLTKLFAFDELVFIPALIAPHKRQAEVTTALHRYAMLALSTQHTQRFRISSVEIENAEKPYTINTLERFRAGLGGERNTELYFVMGADSWRDITTWREWKRVLQIVNTVVVTRPGYELRFDHVTPDLQSRIVDLRGVAIAEEVETRLAQEERQATIYLTDVVMMNVSATDVRRSVARGASELTTFVAPSVADYILKYKLYRGTSDSHETEFINTANDVVAKHAHE